MTPGPRSGWRTTLPAMSPWMNCAGASSSPRRRASAASESFHSRLFVSSQAALSAAAQRSRPGRTAERGTSATPAWKRLEISRCSSHPSSCRPPSSHVQAAHPSTTHRPSLDAIGSAMRTGPDTPTAARPEANAPARDASSTALSTMAPALWAFPCPPVRRWLDPTSNAFSTSIGGASTPASVAGPASTDVSRELGAVLGPVTIVVADSGTRSLTSGPGRSSPDGRSAWVRPHASSSRGCGGGSGR